MFIMEKDPIKGDFGDEADQHSRDGNLEENRHLFLHGTQNNVITANFLSKEIEKIAVADNYSKTHQRIEGLEGYHSGSQALPMIIDYRLVIPNAEVDTCQANKC